MTSNPRIARHGVWIALASAVVLAACGSGGSGTSPSAAGSTAPSSAVSTAPTSAPSSGPKAGQTDTEWGRIWDFLPPGFPTYPGATPDEDASGGPASAVLIVEGVDAKGAATRLQTLLGGAGYSTVGLSGPLEDGSFVLDMIGTPAGCALQVTAKPTGGLTTVTILYGAECPFG